MTFNVRQGRPPGVGPSAVELAQVAAAAMALTAEASDTATIQTTARGAVRSPNAGPRLPTGVTEPGVLDLVPLSVVTVTTSNALGQAHELDSADTRTGNDHRGRASSRASVPRASA